MASLYELNAKLATYEMEFDPDTGEWLNEDELTALHMDMDEKIENICFFIKNRRAEVSAIKKEEESLSERRKAKEREVDRLTTYLANNLQGQKFETPRVQVSWRMTPPAVKILDADKIPQEFLKEIKETKPDLNKIKAKLKEYKAKGETVDWATLTQTNKMSVK